MLRILMIISSFTPTVGGAEKQALILAKALKNSGADVTILTRRRNGTSKTEEIGGVQVIRVGRYLPGRFWSLLSAVAWLVTSWRLRRCFDVLHAHQPYSSALVAGVTGMLAGKPTVCKLPSSNTVRVTKSWRGWVLKRTISRFVVTNSADFREMVRYVGNRSVQLIPNGIFLDREGSATACTARSAEILCVARLEPQKAVSLLLLAFRYIHNTAPSARLVVIGEGSERMRLEQQARHMNLGHAVRFLGRVEPEVVFEYYNRIGVFVNASWYEGISNAMLEAMTNRVPVVASKIPGNVDLVRDGETGLLFEPGDIRGLSEAVLCVLNDPDGARRRAENAYQLVSEDYDIRKVAGQYLALYQDVLGARIRS